MWFHWYYKRRYLVPDQTSVPTMPESAAPPVVTGAPREIADGVYVIPDRRVPLVPNVGISLGDRAALVVDTGFGPRSGANTHTAARELAADRPRAHRFTPCRDVDAMRAVLDADSAEREQVGL